MQKRTLLLTSWFFPHKVIRWEHAVTLLYLGKADSVVDYDERIYWGLTKQWLETDRMADQYLIKEGLRLKKCTLSAT